MKVGILGGGFDPPHVGHIKAGREAGKLFNLDEIWLVPYNIRNLNQKSKLSSKGGSASGGKNQKPRLEMTKLAIRGDKNFKVLDWEIKRGGTTYTINTVLELKKRYPQHTFCWLLGEDLKAELPKWHNYARLIEEIEFVFVKNKVDKNGRKISSSEIRDRVNKGLLITGMVDKKVEEYIYKNGLYK